MEDDSQVHSPRTNVAFWISLALPPRSEFSSPRHCFFSIINVIKRNWQKPEKGVVMIMLVADVES